MRPAFEFRQKVTCALLDCRSDEQQLKVALKLLHESENVIDGWEEENKRLKEQLNPIREWYGGGTEGNRPDIDILTDAMADLQSDRKELIGAKAENTCLKEKINLAIGGINALCLMTHNNPGYEDFQAVKQTLEGE